MNKNDNQRPQEPDFDIDLQIEEARERAYERRERMREEEYLNSEFYKNWRISPIAFNENPFILPNKVGFLGIDQSKNSAALINIEDNILELSDKLINPLNFISVINKWLHNYKIPMAVIEPSQDSSSCIECILTALQIPFVIVKPRTSFLWLKREFALPIKANDEKAYKLSLALLSFRQLTVEPEDISHFVNSMFIAKYGWNNYDKLRLKVRNPFITCDVKKIEIGPCAIDKKN